MIQEQEGVILKDKFKIKAGRQLLCCIGIDIASSAVPIDHYINIFKAIDFNNYKKEARNLFTDCINNNPEFVYNRTEKIATCDYNIMICPIKDYEYYLDKKIFGIVGKAESEFVYNKLIEEIDDCKLCCTTFDKGSPINNFWLTTEEHVVEFQNEENYASMLVDRLGLSHYQESIQNNSFGKMPASLMKRELQYYFKIKLAKEKIVTSKPNATVVDWTNPKVGFLSIYDKEAGRTFSVSGYHNYSEGLKERVFSKLELEDAEREKSKIEPLKPAVDPPLQIHCDEIVVEGVFRFSKKK